MTEAKALQVISICKQHGTSEGLNEDGSQITIYGRPPELLNTFVALIYAKFQPEIKRDSIGEYLLITMEPWWH